FSADPEFNDVSVSMKDDEITYTFTEQGTTYVRFLAANADGTCTTESEPYQVTIGESALECPNAFSPDASEGINDVWKVSYKSLTSFKCWIFDRYGVEMCHFEDPSQGWDGKYKGKYVKSGVYFYVIEATGSDGKKYKKKGDINILKSKNNNTTSNEGTE
ncbi:MAG: gliding motility-associated C-terminal domain-containing protein, partial [Candidatus Limisoma sp.]